MIGPKDQALLAILESRLKTENVKIAPTRTDFRKGAFPQQIRFLQDEDQFKIGHCSRGAAKSYTAGIGIYETMEDFPGCSVFYVTKTRDMARNIMWTTVMKQIALDFSVPIEFNETLLEGRHANGSRFRLTGIDGDRKQQDKLLGGKYKLVVLDEVAFFETDLSEIVYKTLIPAAGRVNGSIWMMSTSSDFTQGLFYEATQADLDLRIPGWSVHEWSWMDNPYVSKEMQATIDKLIAANPLIVNTNHFKQHYLNQWVVDENKLCYRYNPLINRFDGLPKHLSPSGWTFCLGIDLGWEDDNAFEVACYHENEPILYFIDEFCKNQMTFNEVDDKAAELIAHYGITRISIDGANKQGVESMRARSQIPYELADKQDKPTHIELFNADLVQGKIKFGPSCDRYRDEMKQLVWISEGDRIKLPKKEHPKCKNHRTDAGLYLWRMCFHFQSQPVVKRIVIGSRAWYEKQAEDIWEKERAKLIVEGQDNPWPDQGGWADN